MTTTTFFLQGLEVEEESLESVIDFLCSLLPEGVIEQTLEDPFIGIDMSTMH